MGKAPLKPFKKYYLSHCKDYRYSRPSPSQDIFKTGSLVELQRSPACMPKAAGGRPGPQLPKCVAQQAHPLPGIPRCAAQCPSHTRRGRLFRTGPPGPIGPPSFIHSDRRNPAGPLPAHPAALPFSPGKVYAAGAVMIPGRPGPAHSPYYSPWRQGREGTGT